MFVTIIAPLTCATLSLQKALGSVMYLLHVTRKICLSCMQWQNWEFQNEYGSQDSFAIFRFISI
ncbi:hypothetical protein CW304_15255 [Bacillus sp. UFRGS-B20]|nr:hypothetical protein CW304_15255 [Bacillus sp. UFRGS-B20]